MPTPTPSPKLIHLFVIPRREFDQVFFKVEGSPQPDRHLIAETYDLHRPDHEYEWLLQFAQQCYDRGYSDGQTHLAEESINKVDELVNRPILSIDDLRRGQALDDGRRGA